MPNLYGPMGGAAAAAPNNDSMDALRRRLANMPAPENVSAEAPFKLNQTGYQAKDVSGPLAEFDYLRNKTNQQFNSQGQAAQDAMTRRFASMGALNSGAYQKQATNMDQQLSQQRSDALEGIGVQEAAQRRTLQQQEDQKAFQSNEALMGRQFTGEQSQLQRSQQTNLFNAQTQNQFQQFQFDAGSKLAQLDMASNQFGQQFGLQQQQFEHQKKIDEFNQKMGKYQAGHSGGLFGAGGFLGLGIGASSTDEF